jgi:proteasome lid subunit RPN8/RPN11
LSRNGPWRAWVTEDARAELERAADTAHPRETGGILVGVHTAGSRPWIIHAVEIPSKDSGNAHYVVPARSRQQVVKRLRRIHDSRLGYLGEWHSHPLDVGPSSTDLDSIRAIANNPAAGCSRPVLLIARRVGDDYSLDALQYHRNSLRQLAVLDAGPLPLAGLPMPRRPTRRLVGGLRRRAGQDRTQTAP